MQTHSTFRCTPKAFGLAILLSFGLVFVGWAQAGQYRLLAEKSNAVVVAARVQNAEQHCNLEISIQGQATLEREVRAPYFEARIDITPQDVESVTVTWRGKSKRVNDEIVNACPTQGRTLGAVSSLNSLMAVAAPGMLATCSTAANGDFSDSLVHGTTAMMTLSEPM